MTDTKRLAEELRKRILPEHWGTADSYKHHWNLNPKDSLLHNEAADLIARLPEIQLDAERYRWLRENAMHPELKKAAWIPTASGDPPFVHIRAIMWDEVDAAMKFAASSTGDAGEKGNG